MEKVFNSKVAFLGHFLKVQCDEVELPNGDHATREYIIHPGAAMIIPQLKNGNLLMIDQYRHSLKMSFTEFPAGKRDPKESTLDTAKRELREETGYISNSWSKVTTIHPVIGYSNEYIDIYFAKELELAGSPELESGEHISTKEVSNSQLLSLIQNHQLTDVKSQIGAFWYLNFLMNQQS